MKMRHTQWNIEYPIHSAKDFEGLDAEQAKGMAIYINDLHQRLAEADFLLSCHQMDSVPEELIQDYPDKTKYVIVEEE